MTVQKSSNGIMESSAGIEFGEQIQSALLCIMIVGLAVIAIFVVKNKVKNTTVRIALQSVLVTFIFVTTFYIQPVFFFWAIPGVMAVFIMNAIQSGPKKRK